MPTTGIIFTDFFVYTHGWFFLTFDRKQQNCVKQLSFNWKINKVAKKRQKKKRLKENKSNIYSVYKIQ